MVFLSTLTGFIKGWFQGSGWERVKEWTIFWPLYIFLFLKLVFSKNEKNKEEKYLLYLTLSLLFLYIIVPFNARYLVLVIPFLIILTIKQIKKINKLVIKFILIIFAAQVINFLYPGPNDTLGVINQVWRNGSYQDLYSFLDENTTETITRNQFWRQGQTIERSIELINKKIKINNIKLTFPWENKTSTSLEIIYYTPLGKITNIKKIELVRESNVWKIKWNYNLLFPDFEPGDQIVFEHDYGQYGKLINKDEKILSEVTYTPVFYLTPSLIKDESIVQNQLTRLTGLKKHDLEYIYKADWQPDWSVRIAPLKNNLSLNLINLTLLDESISIKNEVLSMVNNKYPQLEPSSGGEIILKKKNGTIKSLLKKNKIDGKDIYL